MEKQTNKLKQFTIKALRTYEQHPETKDTFKLYARNRDEVLTFLSKIYRDRLTVQSASSRRGKDEVG